MEELDDYQVVHIFGVVIAKGYPLILVLIFTGLVSTFNYQEINNWFSLIIGGLMGRGLIFVAHRATGQKFDFAEVSYTSLGAAVLGSGLGSVILLAKWFFGSLPQSFSWSEYFSMLFHNMVLGLII